MRFAALAPPRTRRGRLAAAVASLGLISAVGALAQQADFGADPLVENVGYDGRFIFTRLTYTTAPGGFYYRGLPAWAHGYPNAEMSLMKIVQAVSLLRPHLEGTNAYALDDPELFRHPIAFLAEAGFWRMTDAQAASMREYFDKGGFIIFDDFRNDGRSTGWQNFEEQMERVIPGAHFVDLTPDHPVFHSFFHIPSFDIVPQYYDGGEIVFKGLHEDNDPAKRLIAVVNFNTDTSHFWEFNAGRALAVDPSNQAYRLGVNYIIYGLTH